jgi:hypothetical protein
MHTPSPHPNIQALILVVHPDKGGTAEEFRSVRAAMEVIKALKERGITTSFRKASQGDATKYGEAFAEFEDMPVPSWEFFHTAAEELVPGYMLEIAKTGRAQCVAKGKARKCVPANPDAVNMYGKLIDKGGMIAKGELKIGRLNNETGGYSNFVHLPCFRVPSRWWKGLPDPEASDFDREKFQKEVPRHSPPPLFLHLC